MNPVQVVNIALAEIGTQSSISSFAETSPEANAAGLFYAPKLEALSRAAHWNCLRSQIELTLLKSVIINGVASDSPPPRPWLYEYAYPQDCIKARFILPYWNSVYTGVPMTTAPAVIPSLWEGPPVKFQVATDIINGSTVRVILTDMPQAIMVYTRRLLDDPDLWDPHFLAAATGTLGVYFVNALSRSRGLLQDQIAMVRAIINEARVSDGNEGLTYSDNMPDWIRVRGQLDPYVTGGYFAGWDPFPFPGGVTI